jgi:hypothetical protein
MTNKYNQTEITTEYNKDCNTLRVWHSSHIDPIQYSLDDFTENQCIQNYKRFLKAKGLKMDDTFVHPNFTTPYN